MLSDVVLAALVAAGAMSADGSTLHGGSDSAPTVAGASRPHAAGRFVDGTTSTGAGTRRWRLWIPDGYDASRRYPLIVMLHGCTQDPNDLARGTRATEHADRNGVLVLLVEQPESANPKKCWNWFDPSHQRRDTGEPSLIASASRQVMDAWPVDTRRVYIAGISAGAAMASLVAVAYPDLYAAVALHSGIPYRAASNVMDGVGVMAKGTADVGRLATLARDEMGPRARRIPAIIIQGTDDPVVRAVNATQTRDAWLAMNALVAGVPPSDAKPPTRVEGESGGLGFTRECHQGRESSACEVALVMIAGLGHAWSGGSKAGTFTDERGPDATAEIFRFLLAHPMVTSAAAPNARTP